MIQTIGGDDRMVKSPEDQGVSLDVHSCSLGRADSLVLSGSRQCGIDAVGITGWSGCEGGDESRRVEDSGEELVPG